ncbi:hypothetical protein MPH_04044 [Macrophomina phaseolina MS6]|uniref:Uncharacterized protein n=1 Tax=Macrophomina phaseolina (strain MS6) TaxID=1126212 RepID=K2RV73_MACPH|nr:hypothetical protein MPH_04044 [Macrophomina phaseolina MS6]
MISRDIQSPPSAYRIARRQEVKPSDMGAQQSLIHYGPPVPDVPEEAWGRSVRPPVPRAKEDSATPSLVYSRRKSRRERRSTADAPSRSGSRRRRASEPDSKQDSAARPKLRQTALVRRHSLADLSHRGLPQSSDVLRIPGATLLFDAFLDSTVFQVLPGDAGVAALAPVVLNDDMAMHALLALSGSYLQGAVPGVDIRGRYHYGRALHALRDRVTHCVEAKSMETDKPAMLLTVLLLCNFELNCGDPHKASAVHLNAARQMIRNCKEGDGRKHGWTLLSFAMEYFGFTSISAAVIEASKHVPEVSVDSRTILPTLQSLEELRARFGFDFGLSFPVLAEVPRAIKVTVEEGKSIYTGPVVQVSDGVKVKTEDCDDVLEQKRPRVKTPTAPPMAVASEVLRLTILLFLNIIDHGSQPLDQNLLNKIDPYVDEFYQVIDGIELNGVITAPLMWSCVLFGSCTHRQEQRDLLRAMIQQSSFKPAFIRTVVKVLEHIWSGEDSHAFGPFGIKRVLALRNMNVELRAIRAG